MTIFFGPARNTIFNIRPVWARLGPRQNLLSLMFYNKTNNNTEIIMLIGFLIIRWHRELIFFSRTIVHLLNTQHIFKL